MLEPNKKSSFYNEDEIDLKFIFSILLEGKWLIISITSLISILGVIYSLNLPNIYESKATLAPSNSQNQDMLPQNYNNLASIAGLSLPSSAYESNALQALEKIKSLSFFENYFLPNINLPDLMALKSWNQISNSLDYKDYLYNSLNKEWVREYSIPQKLIPSAQESYDVFIEKHLGISIDEETNFVTIRIKHKSPFIAEEWTRLLIDEINSFYRQKDKREAQISSEYLNSILIRTNLSEIKQTLASLLQQETQKLTLIEASEFYVFEYIDPPAVMEKKSEPKRAIICIIFAFIGGILSILAVFIRYYIYLEDHKT